MAFWAPAPKPAIAADSVVAPSTSKLMGRVPIGVETEIWPTYTVGRVISG